MTSINLTNELSLPMHYHVFLEFILVYEKFLTHGKFALEKLCILSLFFLFFHLKFSIPDHDPSLNPNIFIFIQNIFHSGVTQNPIFGFFFVLGGLGRNPIFTGSFTTP